MQYRSYLPFVPLLYLPGVGIENWLLYSCVGERAGSYVGAAQNIAQHVPGPNLEACVCWMVGFP